MTLFSSLFPAKHTLFTYDFPAFPAITELSGLNCESLKNTHTNTHTRLFKTFLPPMSPIQPPHTILPIYSPLATYMIQPYHTIDIAKSEKEFTNQPKI